MGAQPDGSVEIRITGAVDASVAASAGEAKAAISGLADTTQVSAQRMAAALKAAGGDLKKITPEMLGVEGAGAAEAAVAGVAAKTREATVATEGLKLGTSGAIQEYIRLGHEAMTGNFSRMPGSLVVLASRMGGIQKAAEMMTPGLIAAGVGVASLAAIGIGAAVSAHQLETEQRNLTATTIGIGAASQLSADQIRAAADASSEASGKSSRAALESAEAFAAAGVQSQQAIAELSGNVETFAELTGEKAADAQKTLAAAMQDPVKGAQDLNDALGILDSTQMEAIKNAVAQGDKEKALDIITQALKQRFDEARAAGVGLAGEFSQLAAGASNLWSWLGRVNEQLELFQTFGFGSGAAVDKAKAGQAAAVAAAQERTRLDNLSNQGAALFDKTPEGQDAAKRQDLLNGQVLAQRALDADIRLHGLNSEAVRRDRDALADYTRAVKSFVPEAEKAHRIAELDAQISEARRKHDKGGVEDLTRQKERLQLAGQLMSDQEAQQRAADAADKGGASVGPAKQKKGPKGPSATQDWAEELHAQEIASNDFFSDQTANELKFWQSKLGLVKQGSRDWLEVQGHIYEAEKKLSRDDYENHLADLNMKMEADRDNWTKEQADWQEKLAFIKSKFGEESKDYKDAYRDFERAQRDHLDRMDQADSDAERAAVERLRQHLSTAQQIRAADEQIQEQLATDRAAGSPLGEIRAATEIGRLKEALAQQELTDLQQMHAAESAMLNGQVAQARDKYGEDSTNYRAAVASKLAAEAQFQNQREALEARARQQSIQNVLAVQRAYHSYLDGIVGSSVQAFTGMASGSSTWVQAEQAVWGSLLNTVDSILTRMLTRWIVNHLLMSAAQKAELASQTGATAAAEVTKIAVGKAAALAQLGSYVALAGAGGVASMAAAPFPADLTAPAFGASMAAAAASFGSAAAFERGINEVPADMFALIHAGERVMPAADNRALMAALDRGGGAPGGDTHLHYSPQLAGDTKPFRQQLLDHSSDLMALIRQAHRDGALTVAN